jgi:hypothetical protein
LTASRGAGGGVGEVTDQIQAEKPSLANWPSKSTGDEENPFQVHESKGRPKTALVVLVVVWLVFHLALLLRHIWPIYTALKAREW